MIIEDLLIVMKGSMGRKTLIIIVLVGGIVGSAYGVSENNRGAVDNCVLHGTMGRRPGGDKLFAHEVDEQRWQNLVSAFFRGRLFLCAQGGV